MSTRTLALAAAVLSCSLSARAQTAAPGAGHWSLVTGETVSPDRDALGFNFGWPGIGFTYLHGLSDSSDVGLKLDLLYGEENTNYSKVGFGLAVPLRLVVNRTGKVLIGLHVDPGVRLYSDSTQSDFFLRFPVGGIVGIQATPELRLAVTADLNMALQIPHNTFLEVGPQFGFAAEYYVDRNLLVGLDARFGPQFYSYVNASTDFAFTTEIVVGYRL